MNTFENKWLQYPWLKNSGEDELIHEDDISKIEGLLIVYCISETDDYLTVTDGLHELRVKPIGVNRVLPNPKFVWGDKVMYLSSKGEKIYGEIGDIAWHFAEEKYFFHLTIKDKLNKRRYFGEQLVAV